MESNTPTLRCKVNELCWINKAQHLMNIGKIVTCNEYLGYFQRNEQFIHQGETWYAADTGHLWVISSKYGLETQYGTSTTAHIQDRWLTPIIPRGEEIANNLVGIFDEDTGTLVKEKDTISA